MNADAAAVSVTLEVRSAAPAPKVPLARTGAGFDVLTVVGLTLILVGALAVLLARRLRLEITHA